MSNDLEKEFNLLQNKIQESVDKMIQNISKKSIYPLQKSSYLCMSNCYNITTDDNITINDIQRCIDNCSRKPKNIEVYIQNELKSFQVKLQRCTQMCQDDANDEIAPILNDHSNNNNSNNYNNNNKNNNIKEVEKKLFKCSKGCIDKHISMIPGLEKRIMNEIDKSMN